MKKCIYCGEPLKINFGAEHLRCALKHPHLSLVGWSLFLLGYVFPSVRKTEEKIKEKIKIGGNN